MTVRLDVTVSHHASEGNYQPIIWCLSVPPLIAQATTTSANNILPVRLCHILLSSFTCVETYIFLDFYTLVLNLLSKVKTSHL